MNYLFIVPMLSDWAYAVYHLGLCCDTIRPASFNATRSTALVGSCDIETIYNTLKMTAPCFILGNMRGCLGPIISIDLLHRLARYDVDINSGSTWRV